MGQRIILSEEERKNIQEMYGIINETLRSDKIEIAIKKLSNFFTSHGYNRKYEFFEDTESPYFQLEYDKKTTLKMLDRYKYDPKTREFYKNEGFDIDEVIKSLQKQIDSMVYGDIFIFTDANTPKITKELLSLIESMGYFVSKINRDIEIEDKKQIESMLSNANRLSIMIEPYYDINRDIEGEYLYHTTDSVNLDNILKKGLIPKSKNTRSFYPERIYLSPNKSSMESIKKQLSDEKGGEYVNLRIKNFDGLSLYKDLRFPSGVYTYDYIPPSYIEVI